MQATLAFDVYGTLIDTNGVVSLLEESIGEKAKDFSQTWRDKQLEYSFRRGLMQTYDDFAVCTRQALDYTCLFCRVALTQEQKDRLLERYRTLAPFKDAEAALSGLKSAGFRLYAFSNGCAEAVETLLAAAGMRGFFMGVVSVDEVKTFKPDPAVYNHFLRKAGVTGDSAWLISGNPFDIIGAVSAGMRAAWVRRSEDVVFDPWGIEPTVTVGSLLELEKQIAGFK